MAFMSKCADITPLVRLRSVRLAEGIRTVGFPAELRSCQRLPTGELCGKSVTSSHSHGEMEVTLGVCGRGLGGRFDRLMKCRMIFGDFRRFFWYRYIRVFFLSFFCGSLREAVEAFRGVLRGSHCCQEQGSRERERVNSV